MKTIAWEMTVEVAMEFYKRCIEQKAETESEKVKVLRQLMEEGKMTRVTTTKKSKEEYIRDKAKHFKILRVGRNDETN